MHMTVPLALRSATELQEKAAELLAMAETARMADTQDALRRLAGRFARLAEHRLAEQTDQSVRTSHWPPPQPRDAATTNP